MIKLTQKKIQDAIKKNVEYALSEDLGNGDLTANMISQEKKACGLLFANQTGILCGLDWFNNTYKTLNKKIKIKWHIGDGDFFKKGDKLCELTGPHHTILQGERVAINFLQTLSAVSTYTNKLTKLISGYPVEIYDTRKTIPGLRIAQKYAVLVGGGKNQRLGLFDQILIKENHISAFGTLEKILKFIKNEKLKDKIQIEVESLDELKLALAYDIENILLDNFSINQIKEAIKINQKKAVLEASGNISEKNIIQYAKTGVDRISLGSLTKNIEAIDFSVIIHSV